MSDNPLEAFDDAFLKFDDVEVKLASRPDLHGFILLNQLDPGTNDVLVSSEHDEVWLSFDPETVFKNATEDQLRDLVRCGIRYDDDYDGFCMFV